MLLAAAILAPLLLAVLLAHPAGRPVVLRLGPWAPLPALMLALAAPDDLAVHLPWLLLDTRLALDPVGRLFLGFSALIWLLAGLQARAWLVAGGRRARFAGFFLVAQAGNLGLCMAQGAAGFYAFFALMTFAAYGLVVHAGGDDARRAGRVYLALAVLGEVLILSGLLLLVDAWGGHYLADFRAAGAPPANLGMAAGCLLLGFGVKAGVPLLHVALPLTYAAAPPPAAAALAGAMLKAGLLGWWRFLPLGEAALPELGGMMMMLGAFAVFAGVAIGLTQRDVGALLAYSSISQMGYFLLALGVALRAPDAWPALAAALSLYAGHHALAKSALFLGLGVVRRVGARPLVLLGMALPALALAGAPLTSGLFAKQALKSALAEPGLTEFASIGAAHLPALLLVGSLATALLMARLMALLAREAGQPAQVRAGLAPPWVFALGCLLVLPLWLVPLEGWRATLAWPVLAGATWPIVLALAIAFAAWRLGARAPTLPPGDWLVWVERLLAATMRGLDRLPPWALAPAPPRAAMRSPWLEARLRTLPVAGVVWLGLVAVFVLVLVA